MSIVYPSAGALVVMSVAILPAAPGRLSTMTCWPRRSLNFGVNARAVVSVPPPGAKPTIMRIGRFGYAVLSAADVAEQTDANARNSGAARRAVDFMILLGC